MKNQLNVLEQDLKHNFTDANLLHAALTHRSVRGQNNERLEFLGDSIVNFVIAEALYMKFPQAREGDLSRLRANLVSGVALAELAAEFSLSEYLVLGPGELKSGGAKRASILADAMEAIIAAIYLDSDFEHCKAKILSWYQQRLETTSIEVNLKDPKTQLQEFLQAKKMPLPMYTIKKIAGEAHAQIFCIECKLEGLDETTSGKGSNRRTAEQEAAELMLELLNYGK